MRSFPSFLVLLAMFSISPAENAEYRYFWVVRNGLSTPGEIDELLNRAAEAGANGVLVQVVGRGEAYYSSDVLPRRSFPVLTTPGVSHNEGHVPGLEVHAWVNAFLVWSSPHCSPSLNTFTTPIRSGSPATPTAEAAGPFPRKLRRRRVWWGNPFPGLSRGEELHSGHRPGDRHELRCGGYPP